MILVVALAVIIATGITAVLTVGMSSILAVSMSSVLAVAMSSVLAVSMSSALVVDMTSITVSTVLVMRTRPLLNNREASRTEILLASRFDRSIIPLVLRRHIRRPSMVLHPSQHIPPQQSSSTTSLSIATLESTVDNEEHAVAPNSPGVGMYAIIAFTHTLV